MSNLSVGFTIFHGPNGITTPHGIQPSKRSLMKLFSAGHLPPSSIIQRDPPQWMQLMHSSLTKPPYSSFWKKTSLKLSCAWKPNWCQVYRYKLSNRLLGVSAKDRNYNRSAKNPSIDNQATNFPNASLGHSRSSKKSIPVLLVHEKLVQQYLIQWEHQSTAEAS